MTGFAAVRSQTQGGGELTVSLRSVNGRNLDLHFYLGAEFAAFENAVRALLKRKVGRGHVEVRMHYSPSGAASQATYNQDLLARYLEAFASANTKFGLSSRPDLNQLFALPGLFDTEAPSGRTDLAEDEVLQAAERCIDALNQVRGREGADLLAAISEQVKQIESATGELLAIRERASIELQKRLQERLSTLLTEASVSGARLVEETAILVDRSDIQEEITRLTVHTGELRRLLAEGGEVGKRLDFLLQEMNRETNTVLSKTSGAGETGLTVTNLGIGLKANIEKIREQALNLE